MFEQLNMTKKLKRQISKAVSIALSAAMLVTALPADLLGGVANVKAETETKTYTLGLSDIPEGANGAAVAAGTYGSCSDKTVTTKYFTVAGTVTQYVNKEVLTAIYLEKEGAGTISFTVTGTADVELDVRSNSNSNTSPVALKKLASKDTEEDTYVEATSITRGGTSQESAEAGLTKGYYLVHSSSTSTLKYTVTEGTYVLLSPTVSGYGRGVRFTEARVVETTTSGGGQTTPPVTEDPDPIGSDDGVDIDPTKDLAFDFGADALDSAKYNNVLTEKLINSWYPKTVTTGTSNNNIASFQVKDTEGNLIMEFDDGGSSTSHRLRTTNTKLTRYDEKSLGDAKNDQITYTGYIYSNAGSTENVYLGFNLKKGDILTAYVGTNSGKDGAVYGFKEVSDSDSQNEQSATFDAVSGKAYEVRFYAIKDAEYKLYCKNDKLVVARVIVEHTEEIDATGSVTLGEGAVLPSNAAINFTCVETGEVVEGTIAAGKYSAKLRQGYTYKMSLKNANELVISSDTTVAVSMDKTAISKDVTIEAVDLVLVSGTITVDETANAEILGLATEFVLTSQQEGTVYVPRMDFNANTGTYSVKVEKNIPYILSVKGEKAEQGGINDYEIIDNEWRFTEDTEDKAIAITKKPVHEVTINPQGVTLAALNGAVATFTNLGAAGLGTAGDEGYTYKFTIGTDTIKLRDGVYAVAFTNTGDFKQKLTSNVKVDGEAVTKPVKFEDVSGPIEAGTYDLTGYKTSVPDDITGLSFTGFSAHNGGHGPHAGANSSVTMKLDRKADVTVTTCAYGNGADAEDKVDLSDATAVLSTETGGESGSVEQKIFTITGVNAGDFTVTFKSEVYVHKIDVKYTEASADSVYKPEITVGATGCDYTTINDALAAVRKMTRTNEEVVTIKIAPDDYEEMLVIDTPNVKLVNASATPSIALTNKGVGIADGAVRITSYYGTGYSYYSMGSDSKWNEEVLEVNKENGYYSFQNPGDGTTSGSYWNATVVIKADNVSAEGIIFENSFNQYVSEKAANDVIIAESKAKEGTVPRAEMEAGNTKVQEKAYVERAAALAIADCCQKISFKNCKFVGRQDTLYGGSNNKGAGPNVTAAFDKCSIYGGTDFVMGGMTAVFNECDLVMNTYPADSNDVAYLTAAQTPAGVRGMLFYNCHVTSTTPGVDTISETVANPGTFGRLWSGVNAEAVFVKTTVDVSAKGTSLIQPNGWTLGLGDYSPRAFEYNTIELSGEDNSAARKCGGIKTEAKLSDGTEISVAAFLGDWKPFGDTFVLDLTLPERADKPTASVAPGLYHENKTITLSAAEGAKIYYTLDGSLPSATNGTLYEDAIKVTGEEGKSVETVIKAVAVQDGVLNSLVATFTYTINIPASGTAVVKDGSIDVSNGLVVGTVYGTEDAVSLTVLQDMPLKTVDGPTEVNSIVYPGFIQGAGNASPNAGQIPTSGAAFVIKATVNGSITFVTKEAAKTYHFVDTVAGAKKADTSETAIPLGNLMFNLEAGHTYYFYADGSKPAVYAINYTYEEVVSDPGKDPSGTNDGGDKDGTNDGGDKDGTNDGGDKDGTNDGNDSSFDGWDRVARPVINRVEYSTNDGQDKVTVTVTANVGDQGGQKLVVDWKKVGATTSQTKTSTAKQKTHKFEFTGEGPGKYEVTATLKRKGLPDKITKATVTIKANGKVELTSSREGVHVELLDDGDYTYTGSAIKPAIAVYNGDELLTEGVDYTVKYTNNVKASVNNPSNKKQPTITITGKGKLTGKTTKTFNIKRKELTDDDVFVGGLSKDAANTLIVAENAKINPVLVYKGVLLKTKKDFTIDVTAKATPALTGSSITITGVNNYTGTRTYTLDVKKVKKLTAVKVNTKAGYVYDGDEKEAPITEVKAGKENVAADDYLVVYNGDRTSAGTQKFTVIGVGIYAGSKTTSFKINPRKTTLTHEVDSSLKVGTTVTLSYKSTGVTFNDAITVTDTGLDNATLVLGKDYKVSYSGNKKVTKAGKPAKYTITFLGNYKGSAAIKTNNTFEIKPVNLEDLAHTDYPDERYGELYIKSADKAYGKKAAIIKSAPYVLVDGVALKNSDYTVKYILSNGSEMKGKDKVTLGAGETTTITVEITGKGNYEGKVTTTYEVSNEDKTDISKVKVTPQAEGSTKKQGSVPYSGSAVYPGQIEIKQGKTVLATLKPDANGDWNTNPDFEVTFVNNIEKGKATIIVTGTGSNRGSKTATYNVGACNLAKDVKEDNFWEDFKGLLSKTALLFGK